MSDPTPQSPEHLELWMAWSGARWPEPLPWHDLDAPEVAW